MLCYVIDDSVVAYPVTVPEKVTALKYSTPLKAQLNLIRLHFRSKIAVTVNSSSQSKEDLDHR